MTDNFITFDEVKDYFESEAIEMSVAVENALHDVFDENDISEDNIFIYSKGDMTEFSKDLTLMDNINIRVSCDEPGEGVVHSVFTYYGDITYVKNEITTISHKNIIIETPVNIMDSDNFTFINNPEDFAIIVISIIQWKGDELDSSIRLHIYTPYEIDEEEDVDG